MGVAVLGVFLASEDDFAADLKGEAVDGLCSRIAGITIVFTGGIVEIFGSGYGASERL